MRRDIAFRQTVVHSQTALALISTHPDEPTTEIVTPARHAVAQCRSSGTDPDVELSPLPSDTTPQALLAIYQQVLGILMEEANEKRPPVIATVDDMRAHAELRRRYIGPITALLVVTRCELVQSPDIARFALEAAVDAAAASLG